MDAFLRRLIKVSVAALLLGARHTAASEVQAGYNAFSAAQVSVNLASHSWEFGTTAEAMLELYNPELSVFGANPFPGGKVPDADPGTLALVYAKQFISLSGDVLVPDSAVGDPASLGVSAILLGQSNSAYLNAANNQANNILNVAPKWTNGAISQRPDVAEIWADFSAMALPFLAYLAVQQGNATLMAQTVAQSGLQRAVLQSSSGGGSWMHIIGPQSQDTGLWSTGNGWAAYGMVRVLHTLQKWSGSSSMTSQAASLKGWIQEILNGAMQTGLSNGLLRNYLGDTSWFGEISGTAMLTAVAYRMAVNDPSMFPQKYITWADANRKSLAAVQGSNGIFAPAVDPYNWLDRTQFTSGSPEGQAFTVFAYTAFRDCVGAGVCAPPTATASTVSASGIGPFEILTVLNAPVTFSAMPAPSGVACGGTPQSCDANGCKGAFSGLTANPVCTAGEMEGCPCTPTSTTCGARQSCDNNGCKGAFNGLTPFAQCTGNFVGCNCTASATTCGARQSCDNNGCAGKFAGSVPFAQCTGNFIGCNCTATTNTCGASQSCDNNGCAGEFNLDNGQAFCTENFVGCGCTATSNTCGTPQPCENGNCAGKFNGNVEFPTCTNFFKGCQCEATATTCGSPQSCDNNVCAGVFTGNTPDPVCSGNFKGCTCKATPNTCGESQPCDDNGCAGAFHGNEVKPQCTGNFVGCNCTATEKTCGSPQSCDANGCGGQFVGLVRQATCRNNFVNCVCTPTSNTCGTPQSCSLNGCTGSADSNGGATCKANFQGCPCLLGATNPSQPPPPPPPPPASLTPVDDWFCVGVYTWIQCVEFGGCQERFGYAATDQFVSGGQLRLPAQLGESSLSNQGICGSEVFNSFVNCDGQDITDQCSGYTVSWNNRVCRTYCPSFGDSANCFQTENSTTEVTLSNLLICDRELS